MIKNKIISISRLIIFLFILSFNILQASIINPTIERDMPGLEAFEQGLHYFDDENLEDASHFFLQAIVESYKPSYSSSDFELDEDHDKYYLENEWVEINFAVYKHSHFYLGLINLRKQEFNKAAFHFKKSIYCGGGKRVTLTNPAWIIYASLTHLYLGKLNEAKKLGDYAEDTLDFISEYVIDRSYWSKRKKQWEDLQQREINEKWTDIQHIMIANNISIIAAAQKDLNQAVEYASKAIRIKDGLLKEQLIEESAEDSLLYNNRGMLYSEIDSFAEALFDFDKAIELDPLNAEIYLNRACVYLKLEEYEKAINDYNYSLQLNFNNADAYRQRALAYFLADSLENAILDIECANEIENGQLHEQNDTGIEYFSKNEFQSSILNFTKLIQTNPVLITGYQNRGAAYYQSDSFDKAIEDFSYALTIDANKEELYEMRGMAFLALSQFEQAEQDFLAAIQLNPTLSAYMNLAALYYVTGDLDQALNCYKNVVSLNLPIQDPIFYKNLAIIYFCKNEFNNALLNCNKFIEINGGNESIYLIRGLCLYEMHKFEEAIDNYTLAIETGYGNFNIYFNRGQTYYYLLKFDESLSDFTQAIQLDPNHAGSYKFRGLVYLHLEQEFEAYTDIVVAINLANSNQSNEKNLATYKKFLDYPANLIKFGERFYSLDDLYMSLFQTNQLGIDENNLADKFGDISLNEFNTGLVIGLLEGGVELVQELGPFLSNLLFHPFETTEEILNSIKILIENIAHQEWLAVCESLAPELRELYLTWNEIDDYRKGNLAGKFIGKNGVGALIGMGAVKSIAKLKNVVIGGNPTICRWLKKAKPEIPTQSLPKPASLFDGKIPIYPPNSWVLPCEGGAIIGTRYYTEHALARMAPKKDLQVLALLEERVLRRAETDGINIYDSNNFQKWLETKGNKKYNVDPRGIPPSVVEAEIANPGSTGIKVIINEKGNVITVIPGEN